MQILFIIATSTLFTTAITLAFLIYLFARKTQLIKKLKLRNHAFDFYDIIDVKQQDNKGGYIKTIKCYLDSFHLIHNNQYDTSCKELNNNDIILIKTQHVPFYKNDGTKYYITYQLHYKQVK